MTDTVRLRRSGANLAKLLAPKVSQYERASRSADPIQPADVAFALGTLREPQETAPDGTRRTAIGSRMVRARWALDEDAMRALMTDIHAIVSRRAMRQSWRVKPGVLERMTYLLLREAGVIRPLNGVYVPGGEMCHTCHGVKKRLSRRYGRWYNCLDCKMTGFPQWSENARAEFCGLHHKLWSDSWSKRYAKLKQGVLDAEDRALRRIKARCR